MLPLPTTWYSRVKHAGDFAVALVLFATSAPLVLVLALLVKLTSPGPAIYTQSRTGLNGRVFRIRKLRTMYADAERNGPQWCESDDPRVTPLGRFLRKTHLDELPQLWNVLCGEMSLVGPRPERPEIVVELEKELPYYQDRLHVRPGITGLAQVQLPPDTNLASVGRKLAYDVYYIRHLNAWLDLRIMAGTALRMAGVPFPVLKSLLGLPRQETVERQVQARRPGFA